MENIADTWNRFKAEQPELALALSVLPVSGQASAAVEYYDAIRKGDTQGAILAATSFIPGGRLIKEGKAGLNLAKTYRNLGRGSAYAPEMNQIARRETKIAAEQLGIGAAGVSAGVGLDAANYIESRFKK